VDYELKGGVLKVFKELDYDYDVSFDRACSDLVASREADLVIDLSRIRRITSTYVGLMAATFFLAKAHSKNISIIAQGPVLSTIRMAGFGSFVPLIDASAASHPS
jgi:anti-anti-sigma regulatory factor